MCRLAVYQNAESAKALAWALVELEMSQGGQGNGYWSESSNKAKKGLGLSVADIAHQTHDEKGLFVFHTRIASSGDICDGLCHPFPCGEFGFLFQNGVWGGWRAYADTEESDTQTAARLVEKYGPGILLDKTFNMSGVWIVAGNFGVFVIRHTGTFFLQPMDGPDREANTRAAVDYCLEHPRWRLSLQTHKYLGIP